MVLQCVVCKRLDYLNPDLTFHRFPTDSKRKQKWLEILDFKGVSTNSRICSSHFAESDLVLKGEKKKRFLSKDAAPIPFSDAINEPHTTRNRDYNSQSDQVSAHSSTTLTAFKTECATQNIQSTKLPQGLPWDNNKNCTRLTLWSPEDGSQMIDSASAHSCTTLTDPFVNIDPSPPKKRKTYIAETLSTTEFSTPPKTKCNYTLLHQQNANKKLLEESVRRLRARVKALKSLALKDIKAS